VLVESDVVSERYNSDDANSIDVCFFEYFPFRRLFKCFPEFEMASGYLKCAGAMAAKPRLLLIDEPFSGLDPITSLTIDYQIIKLRDLENVTSVVVTHQLRDAFYVATHQAVPGNGRLTIVPADEGKANAVEFIMLKDSRIHFHGTAAQLRASSDPYLRKFLS